MKKITAILLALIMVLSLFAGCQADPAETTAPTTTGSAGTTAPAAEDTTAAPEIQYPEELSVFLTWSSRSEAIGQKTYNDAYWAKWMEEQTGTHVEWIAHNSDVISEKFTLMIAGENYPDAVVYDWKSVEGGPELYLEDEVIIDLTDLIPKCMPNLNAYLEENPQIKKDMTNDNGQILYIPFIREQQALNIYTGPQIRTDWLEKLELEVPKTPDELYEVLKAFKTKDPNGNGEADEIPMSSVGFQNAGMGAGGLLWAFDTHQSFYVKDGKVVWGPAEEEITEGLSFIAKLYSEGLLDIDYLLNDRTAMDSKALADRVGFEFSYQPSKYYSNKDFNDGTRVMAGIPYLTTPDNDSLMCFNPSYTQSVVTGVSLAVTTACENPEGLLKWLDTVYSEEGIAVTNFGEENNHFTYVDGKPQMVELDSDGKKDQQAQSLLIQSVFPILQQWDAYSSTTSEWGGKAIATWADGVDTSGILPQISLTPEENERIADKLTQLDDYAQTEMNNVIIGETSIDEWPEIVEKFQKMGLDEVLAIYNAAYQRYLAK